MKSGTPSETALRVAGARVSAARDPVLRQFLVDPEEPYSSRFVRAHSSRARWLHRAWTFGPTRRLLGKLSEAAFPGGVLHILLRKRFVEEQVREALCAGVEQVVVFGAGLDPLCLRLAREVAGISFFEIDHPDTQGVKRRALGRSAEKIPGLHLLSVDFSRETAEQHLRSAPAFRASAPTFFLAEGLLMYLAPREVDDLFTMVRRLTSPGSRFLFSVVDRERLEAPEDPVARFARLLERVGEPIRSSQYRGGLQRFCQGHGFRLTQLTDAAALRRRYVEPAGLDRPVLNGELLVAAVPAG